MNRNLFIGTLYQNGVGTSATGDFSAMLEVPMPQQGMQASSFGYSETLDFEYGGSDVIASAQTHRRYEMNWGGRDVTDARGMDQVKRLSQGEFGKGLIYFADPYNYNTNLLPPQWAAPAMIRSGWRSIYDTEPSGYDPIAFANTSNQPMWSPVFSITNAANALPTDKRSILPLVIPPGMYLHLGFSASATGTAKIRVRPVKLDGSYDTVVDLTLLTWSNATRFNHYFSGNTYKAVEIYFTRTSTATSTLTVTSGMARLTDSTATPSTSTFTAGQGNTGCRFETAALEEEYRYVQMGRNYHIKGLSGTLIEVGTAKRYA